MKQGGVFLMEKTMSVEEKIKRADFNYPTLLIIQLYSF